MGWKEWPSWLKGGLIGVLVCLILFVMIIFVALGPQDHPTLLSRVFNKLYPVLLFILPFNKEAYHILFDIIIYFFVGAIVGLVIEKIKSKKQQPQNQQSSK